MPRRKAYKRRYKPKGKTARIAKVVAKKVVNTALAKNIETKKDILNYARLTLTGVSGQFYIANPLYDVPVGTDDFARLGSKVQHAKLHLRGTYYHRGYSSVPGTTTSMGSHFRIMVVRAPQHSRNNTRGTFDTDLGVLDTQWLPADVFYNADGTNFHMAYPNLNKVKILYDHTIYEHHPDNWSSADNYTLSGGRMFKHTIPLGTLLYKTSSNPSYFEGQQVYILVFVSGRYGDGNNISNATNDRIGYLDLQHCLTWKDA